MKLATSITTAIGLTLASLPALASLELAQKNACVACHGVDKKIVGPAYRDVAKKYAGQKDAVALLSESIRKGGAGKWGPVPMPAQPALSDADGQDPRRLGPGRCQVAPCPPRLHGGCGEPAVPWHAGLRPAPRRH